MEVNDNIQYITILPGNQYSFHYLINDQDEVHSYKLSKGEQFVLQFISKKHRTYINELLYSFIPFVIDIENKSIIELEIDKQVALSEIKKQIYSKKTAILQKQEEEKELDKVKELAYNNKQQNNIFRKMVDNWKL